MNELKTAMITHYQSSGSVYLHSLLDGHPQIMTIPGVPQLDSIIHGTFKDTEDALNVFNNNNPKFYDTSKMSLMDPYSSGLYRLGENADEGIITNQDLFSNYYFDNIHGKDLTPKNIILAFYIAYAKSHNIDIYNKKVILFHPHDMHRTIAMNNIFPDSKYLVTIREPVRGYYSRLNLMKNKSALRKIVNSHVGLLRDDANNVNELLEKNVSMKLIKIEDFAEHSKSIMQQLCKYLDIDYNLSLETSSFNSKLYWGANPKYKNNKFSNIRHIDPIPVKKNERVLFSIINHELNKITGYPSIKLSWLERKLKVWWLFLPFSEDIKWTINAFYYNKFKGQLDYYGRYQSRIRIILRLIKERFDLLYIYIRNSRKKGNYDKIKGYLIKPHNGHQDVCPLCNSINNRVVDNYRDENFLNCELLIKCYDCDLVFASKMPSSKELNAYYSSGLYYGKVTNPYSQDIQEYLFKLANSRLKLINEKIIEDEYRFVLDVGAGNALFGKALLSQYPDSIYDAVEPDIEIRNQWGSWVTNSFDNISKVKENKYSLIILSQILEHVNKPIEFLNKISTLVKRGGYIYIDVPYKDYLFKSSLEPHILFWNKKSLNILIKKIGLEVIFNDTAGMNFNKARKYFKDSSLINKLFNPWNYLRRINNIFIRFGFQPVFDTFDQLQADQYGGNRHWLRCITKNNKLN